MLPEVCTTAVTLFMVASTFTASAKVYTTEYKITKVVYCSTGCCVSKSFAPA